MKSRMGKNGFFLAAGLCLAAAVMAAPEAAKHGVDVSYMDTSVKPCDDFYRYANGAWLKTAQMPKKNYRWGMAQEVRERNTQIQVDLLQQLAGRGDWPRGSLQQKIGDFYRSGMDGTAIEKAGLNPLASRFARLQSMRTPGDLAAELGRLHSEFINPCFSFDIGTDDKNSSSLITYIQQGGLGLPDRDNYLEVDDKTKELLKKYRQHVVLMFELLGDGSETAGRNAEAVLAIETHLAKASLPQTAWDDPKSIYNKMSRAQLPKEAPGFAWEEYFKAISLPDTETDLMVQPLSFFREFAAMAAGVPLADWKAYLRWHLIHSLAPYLSETFAGQDFQFFSRTLRGIQEPAPRPERVQREILNSTLDMAMGRLFVERAFNAETKARVTEMIRNIISALRETILELDWMSESTKTNALKKLEVMVVKVGYPERWRDYAGLEIDGGPYVLNVLRGNAFEFQRRMAQLGKPVDRSQWQLSPAVLNAYCHPWTNEVCFAAGILQPPFFDPEADDASNYGAIGSIIAHELTHDFDAGGRQYDETGSLKDWWTEEDSKAYEDRTAPFVNQYDAYKPLPDKAIDGKLTMNENIADLGGLKIAFSAFKKSLAGKPRASLIDGFSPEQRFFISFAQLYREIDTPEYRRRRLEGDNHSPSKYRVIGPLANFAPFHEIFGCQKGDPMRPADEPRPAIW